MSKKRPHRICIIGDSMLDRYIVGSSPGMTPEARVPLVREIRKEDRPGGAANVALNLKALGAKPQLISLIGNDEAGSTLRKLLKSKAIPHELIIDLKRQTNLKSRIVDEEFNQFLRLDSEKTHAINKSQENLMIAILDKHLSGTRTDAVIIQDYNKGLLTPRIIKQIQQRCKEISIPLLVDPKHENFELLSNCTLFKPNLKECRDYLNDAESRADSICKHLVDRLEQAQNIVITLASKGMYYSDRKHSGRIPAHRLGHADVSGAGDTVIAALAIFLLEQYPLKEMVSLANKAGALSCMAKGVSAISMAEIQAFKA